MLFPKYLGNNNIKNSPITIDDINEIVKTVISYPKLSAPKRYRAIGLEFQIKEDVRQIGIKYGNLNKSEFDLSFSFYYTAEQINIS